MITRYAPSPTGLLHLGNIYSALRCFGAASEAGGVCLLRIEDIDLQRCKPEYEEAIYEDLAWVGCEWPLPVRRQSEHLEDYEVALEKLRGIGVLYPCFCSRRQIRAEIAGMVSAPHGPDGALYPGICRGLDKDLAAERIENGEAHSWRLDCDKAQKLVGDIYWEDKHQGRVKAEPAKLLGDAILGRKDTPASYNLSVVVDDSLQEVTHIIRGRDLFHATHLHVLLQALLGYVQPLYHHHDLIKDMVTGERLSKRSYANSLASMRENGKLPLDIIRELGLG